VEIMGGESDVRIGNPDHIFPACRTTRHMEDTE